MEFSKVTSVSLVIPVYNEVENLLILFREIASVMGRNPEFTWECLFVDDGSTDGSVAVLRDLAQAHANVKTVFFVRNFGQTAAMACGIQLAKQDIIIPMDADLQNNPEDIPRFLEKIQEGFDCVSGWRKNRKDDLFLRKIPSWAANACISRLTGVALHDYGCSMKAYRRKLIQGVPLYGEMHRFIPAYVAWSGGKVTEIVVNHRARIHGVSKYGISRVFKVLLDLLVVKFITKYFNKPMHFFGGVGFLSLFLGVLSELAAIYLKLGGHQGLVQTPLPIVGALFLIVGVQLILSGLLAEVLMRVYYEAQKKQPFIIQE